MSLTDGPGATVVTFAKGDLDGSGVRTRFARDFAVDLVFTAVDAAAVAAGAAAQRQLEAYAREAACERAVCEALLAAAAPTPACPRDGSLCWFAPRTPQDEPVAAKTAHARSQAAAARLSGSGGGGTTGGEAEDTVVKCGWLVKQGHAVRNWKRRWCVLRPRVLEYYTSPRDALPRGTVRLADVCAVVPDAAVDAEHACCFELVVLGAAADSAAAAPVSYFMCAADDALRAEWVEDIELQRMQCRDERVRTVCLSSSFSLLLLLLLSFHRFLALARACTGTGRDSAAPAPARTEQAQRGVEPVAVNARLAHITRHRERGRRPVRARRGRARRQRARR